MFFMVITSYGQTLEQQEADKLRKIQVENGKKFGLPMVLIDATVTFNSIGIPVVNVLPQNIGSKSIDAFTVQISCYDNFDKPVTKAGSESNIFIGISQEYQASGRDNYVWCSWVLNLNENTTKVKVYLKQVHFWDGTTWSPKDKKVTMVEGSSTD